MEDLSEVQLWLEGRKVKKSLTVVSFFLGIAFTILLQIWSKFAKKKIWRSMRGSYLHLSLVILTPFMTLVGAVTFFYEEWQRQKASLLVCEPYFPHEYNQHYFLNLLKFIVHAYFIVRLTAFWAVYRYVELFTTPVVVALFTQDIYALISTNHLIAFQYLILHVFFSQENRTFYLALMKMWSPARFRSILRRISQLCYVIIFLAGSMRVIEEWDTNMDFHPMSAKMPQNMNTLLEYVYFIVITISTIGYGDYVPTTNVGRIVTFFIITNTLAWFSWICNENNEDIENIFKEVVSDTPCVVIAGCREGHQIAEISKCFDFNYEEIITLAEEQGLKTVTGFQSLRSKKAEDTILFLRRSVNTTLNSDKYNINFVRLLRAYGCKAKFIIELDFFHSQQLISKIQGFDDKMDTCLSLEFVKAHALALSAHSRLAASFISKVVMHQLVFDNFDYLEIVNSVQAVRRNFLFEDRILLGYASEENKFFCLPEERPEFNWTRIFLDCKSLEQDWTRRAGRIPINGTSKVKFKAISSKVAIVGSSSDVLHHAFGCHNVTETDCSQATTLVLSSDNSEEFIREREKHNLGQTRFISTSEHGYSCYKDTGKCVCGTYDTHVLLREIVKATYTNPKLYAFWMTLLSEDYLEAEILVKSCTCKNLFTDLLSQNKVLVAIETNWPKATSPRIPVICPSKNFIVHKGDIVLYIKKQILKGS